MEFVDEDGDEAEDIVFVNGDEITEFVDVEEMAKALRARHRKSPFDRFPHVGGISGLLAVGMLASIC